jgi:hypothetical protein
MIPPDDDDGMNQDHPGAHHKAPMREGRPEEIIYDEWFYALPKDDQDNMRKHGCGPYAEMGVPRYSFPIYDPKNNKSFMGDDPRYQEPITTSDTWVSQERMQEIIADVLAMMGASSDPAVVAHFDLIKIVMQMPNAPTQVELAHKLGLTKQAVSVRAKKLLAHASRIAPGLLDRTKTPPDDLDDEKTMKLPFFEQNSTVKKSI